MYSKLPNLVLGFHGCDRETFEAVVRCGEPFSASHNDYDWLGSGVYFWEQNYERAVDWAFQQQARGSIGEPAVIGAVIDLGHCLNLTDSRYIKLVAKEYEVLKKECAYEGVELPQNVGTDDKLLRRLDCAVIEHLNNSLDRGALTSEGTLAPFDSARGLFSEGAPIYPGAGFKEKTHVQICVRNPNCIKGVFEPQVPRESWPIP